MVNNDVNININTKADLKGIQDAERAYDKLLAKMKNVSLQQIASGKVESGAGFESFGRAGGKSVNATIQEVMNSEKTSNDIKQKSLTLQQNQNAANLRNLETSGKQFRSYDAIAGAMHNLESQMKVQETTHAKFRKNALMFGLSVLFAGMALQKAMEGLLQPAMDAVGIFDIFSAALLILFLPAVIALLPWALKFLDFVTSLDEQTKLLIGGLAIFLMLLGGVMVFIGSVSAFVSGLGAVGGAAGVLEGVSLALAGIGGFFLSPAGVALLAAAGFFAGKAAYDEKKQEIEVNAPFISQGISGASALAQEIPFIGGPAGAVIEAAGGLEYLFADALFGENGLFRQTAVNLLAFGTPFNPYGTSSVNNSSTTNIGQQIINQPGVAGSSVEDIVARTRM